MAEKLNELNAAAAKEYAEKESAILEATRLAADDKMIAANKKKLEAEEALKRQQVELEQQAIEQAQQLATIQQLLNKPENKNLLVSFTTPGYHNHFNHRAHYLQKQPVSYSGLRDSGALQQTPRGITNFIRITCIKVDKERPRWGFQVRGVNWNNIYKIDRLTESDRQRIVDAQKLLTDYGDMMVELKMLTP